MPVTQIGINLPQAIGATAPRSDEIVVEARPSRFADLVDVANPLQHVPLVSDVYRAKTGDEIGAGAKFGGHVAIGAIAGGPIGALVGAGVYLLEELFGGAGRHSRTEAVGLSVRSADRAAAAALAAGGTERIAPGTAPVLSSAEFAALIASFDTPKDDARTAAEDAGGR